MRYAFCSPNWQLLYYRGPPWTNWRPLHDAGHMRCVRSPRSLSPSTHTCSFAYSLSFSLDNLRLKLSFEPLSIASNPHRSSASQSQSHSQFKLQSQFRVLVAVQVLVPLSHSESLTHSLPWRFKMLVIKCKIIEFLIDSIDAAHSVRFFLVHCN